MPRMKVWSATQNNWIFADESLPSRDVIIDDEAPSNINAVWVDISDNDVDDIAISNVVGLQSALNGKQSKVDLSQYWDEEEQQTSEIDTGNKWVDGKTIWSRTFYAPFNNGENQKIIDNLSEKNINNIIKMETLVIRANTVTMSGNSWYSGSDYCYRINVDYEDNCIYMNSFGYFNDSHAYLTVWYTKTEEVS